ncbi:MAG: haloacid dehalogenase-like hydrolase [Eubacterium sp.]|nr:haloacid dehalogenase-like hydrolase [Eubacterium sp.]
MTLDIYDFDKTLVPFDSGSKFTLYCFIRYPWCIIFTPVLAIGLILALLKIIDFTAFKKICFLYVTLIPLKKAVGRFWDKYEKCVFPWFKQRDKYSVIISASPDFLIEEISKRLEADKLICTRHNPKTGAIVGENCRYTEKVRRFYEEFDKNEVTVCDVYSDSLEHDEPIFSLATGRCYHIVNGKKIPFDYFEEYKK